MSDLPVQHDSRSGVAESGSKETFIPEVFSHISGKKGRRGVIVDLSPEVFVGVG